MRECHTSFFTFNRTPKETTHELLVKALNRISESYKDRPKIYRYFELMISNNGALSALCDPLNAEAREELLTTITKLTFVRNEDKKLNYAISDNSKLVINEINSDKVSNIHIELGNLRSLGESTWKAKISENQQKSTTLDFQSLMDDYRGFISQVENFKNSINQEKTVRNLVNSIQTNSDKIESIRDKLMKDLDVIDWLSKVDQDINYNIVIPDAIMTNYNNSIETILQEINTVRIEKCKDEFKEVLSTYDVQSRIQTLKSQSNFDDKSLSISKILSPLSNELNNELKEKLKILVTEFERIGADGKKCVFALVKQYVINPFTTEFENNQIVVKSNVPNIALSEVIKSIDYLPSYPKIKGLKILADNTLYFDANLEKEHYSGKNVTICASNINLSDVFRVNTGGMDGESTAKKPSKPGKPSVPGTHGIRGADAQPAHNGNPAGNIIFITDSIEGGRLILKANGGHGGSGQSGGDGGDGSNGSNGSDAPEPESFGFFDSGCRLNKGDKGQRGGDAGQGGNAAFGGKGGFPGKIILKTTSGDDIEFSQIVKESNQGRKGVNGTPGNPGLRGIGGLNGYDIGIAKINFPVWYKGYIHSIIRKSDPVIRFKENELPYSMYYEAHSYDNGYTQSTGGSPPADGPIKTRNIPGACGEQGRVSINPPEVIPAIEMDNLDELVKSYKNQQSIWRS